MKHQLSSRVLGVFAVLAIAASACSSSDTTDADAAPVDAGAPAESDPKPAPTTNRAASTTTSAPLVPATTAHAVSETTEPATASASRPTDVLDLVEVTVDEIGVSTVAPRSWTKNPNGAFGDGISQIGVFAVPTNMATDPAFEGFEPIGQLDAGGHSWQLFTLDGGDVITGLATTEIGDIAYGFVLEAPSQLAEGYFDSVVTPALEAFEAEQLPTVDDIDSTTIDVDGRTVAYSTAGSGSPTVVFEAGLGNGMETWTLVAPAIAQKARVFGYDRPGYGGSDLTDDPRDGAAMVAELRELLIDTGHEPPYVLVGHSLGGTLMDLFARTHPDEVAGVVLVDSRHHDFTARCLAQFGVASCDIPSDAEVAATPRPIRDEWLGLTDTVRQINEAPDFPDVPLAVIVAGIAEGTSEYDGLWRQTQQDYADMVPGSLLLVAERSDHGIPAQQPEIIIDAITEILQGDG